MGRERAKVQRLRFSDVNEVELGIHTLHVELVT